MENGNGEVDQILNYLNRLDPPEDWKFVEHFARMMVILPSWFCPQNVLHKQVGNWQ